MCELFGMSCNSLDRANVSLSNFARYSRYNPDGWGIAYYQNGNVQIYRQPQKAANSPDYLRTIDDAKSNIIIAHIRFATQGDTCEKNCHPFYQNFLNRNWIFAHNGNISNIGSHPRAIGETDSERLFNHMLDKIQLYLNTPLIRGVYPGIKKAIRDLFREYTRNITLNFLLADGTLLYIFNHYSGKPMYYLKRSKSYGGAFLVSTQRLTDERWEKIPPDRLLVVNNGEVLILSKLI